MLSSTQSSQKYTLPTNQSSQIPRETTFVQTKTSVSTISFIRNLVIISFGIYVLIENPGAHRDVECGNVYEWVITWLSVIIIFTLGLSLLNLCNKRDKTLEYLCYIGAFSCAIWICVNFNNKYNDACRTKYQNHFNSLYWYYCIMLYFNIVLLSLSAIYMILLLVICVININIVENVF